MAGHEKIKTDLTSELFVGKLSEQILGDVYKSLTLFIKLGVIIEVTAVGYGYSFEVEYRITKHKLLKLAVINTLSGTVQLLMQLNMIKSVFKLSTFLKYTNF